MEVALIEVKQGEILVRRGERLLRLPFEATVRTTPESGALEGDLKLTLAGQEVTVKGRLDLAAGRWWLDGEGEGLRLVEVAAMAGLDRLPALSGTGRIRGQGRGRLSPAGIEILDVSLHHSPCRLNWGDVRLDLSGATPEEDLHVSIRMDNEGRLAVESDLVHMRVPGGEGRFALSGFLEKDEGGLKWQGGLASTVALDRGQSGRPLAVLPLDLQSEGQLSPDGRWQVRLHMPPGGASPPGEGPDAGRPLNRLGIGALEARAEGTSDPFQADARFKLSTLELAGEALKLSVKTLEGTGRYGREDAAGEGGTLTMTLGTAAVSAGGLSARFKAVRLAGEGHAEPDQTFRLAGALAVDGGDFQADAWAVKGSGFSLRLPLTWPPPQKAQGGTLNLASASWNKRALGSLTGAVRQTVQGLAFDVRHANRLVPDLVVAAQGELGLHAETGSPFAKVSWTADRPNEAPPLQVSDLMPEPPGIPITFSGRVFARGEMSYDRGLQGALSAGVSSGRLQVDDQGVVVEGIETTLHFPDALKLRSAPAQIMTFEAVSFGAVRAEVGRLAYQIEPGPAVFLENGRFQWCGGTLIAPATRFTAGKKAYDVTVFCDRLRLDQLLEQLGLAKVEGGGAISGLIPVSLTEGRLTFNNAFLYSSPGEGGVIRVQGSEVLTAGVPPGTPQYNQMELARHALKDYDYQWAKITMNSVADDLLVQLQFDGKPADTLPFIYDPASGGFVKTAPGQPGSTFQGIRLDVNVTLPLNRMLRYRELFKKLQ